MLLTMIFQISCTLSQLSGNPNAFSGVNRPSCFVEFAHFLLNIFYIFSTLPVTKTSCPLSNLIKATKAFRRILNAPACPYATKKEKTHADTATH